MKATKPPFESYVLVCTRERETNCDACGTEGQQFKDQLKKLVQQHQLHKQVRVSETGCLGSCVDGPNILVMPQKLWFDNIRAEAIQEIFQTIRQSIIT